MPRTIFITDAASPLGRACAVRLGRAGWNVIMGASSLSSLEDICGELPDTATLPSRCVPTDIGNVVPVLEDGEDRFGSIDAILVNSRAKRVGWRRTLDSGILSLAVVSEAARPFLTRSEGHLVIAGVRGGQRSMGGAMQTVARQASKVIVDALEQDWEEYPIRISLVEPHGLDGPKQMARRIARTLNGAPPRRPIHREQPLIASRY